MQFLISDPDVYPTSGFFLRVGFKMKNIRFRNARQFRTFIIWETGNTM